MTIVKKFDTDIVNPKSFSKKYIVFSIFGLLFLVVLEIWISNTTLTFGEKFESMQNAKNNLSLQNELLENKIAKNSSLGKIASESAELGFSSPSRVQYIR